MICRQWGCSDFWLFYGQQPNEAIWIFEEERQMRLAQVQALAEARFQAKLPLTVAAAEGVRLAELAQ